MKIKSKEKKNKEAPPEKALKKIKTNEIEIEFTVDKKKIKGFLRRISADERVAAQASGVSALQKTRRAGGDRQAGENAFNWAFNEVLLLFALVDEKHNSIFADREQLVFIAPDEKNRLITEYNKTFWLEELDLKN